MPGKVKYHQLTEKEKKIFLGEFYSVVASLKSRDDVKIFFKDLLTLSEITMISRRIQVAKMLMDGQTTREIREALKIGYSTINSVERWLNNGFGGYKKILMEYNAKVDKLRSKKQQQAYRQSMLKKYPHHRLLLDIFGI